MVFYEVNTQHWLGVVTSLNHLFKGGLNFLRP